MKEQAGTREFLKAIPATYCENPLLYGGNNPFLETLPPLLQEKQVLELFYHLPKLPDSARDEDRVSRYLLLENINQLRVPFSHHVTLYLDLVSMIHEGYKRRNPLENHELKRMRDLELQSGPKDFSAVTMTLLGTSGIGKTTAVDTILSLFPQTVAHTVYHGEPFTKIQINYLKVDCPYDGAIGGFCREVLRAFDKALGNTSYMQQAVRGRHSLDTMISNIAALCNLYNVGLLVIEEIQHLLDAQKGGRLLTNLFTTLTNTCQVPVLFIGTPRAEAVFEGNLRTSRRFISENYSLWNRIEDAQSSDWKLLVESLFEIQLTRENTPLSEELSETLYDRSQGILAIVKSLYKRVQRSLILDRDDKKEIITPERVVEVAKKDFKPFNKIIGAIKRNDIEALERMEDVLLNLKRLQLEETRNFPLVKPSADVDETEKQTEALSGVYGFLVSAQITENLTNEELLEITRQTLSQFKDFSEMGRIRKAALEAALRADKEAEKRGKADKESLRELIEQSRKELEESYGIL